MNSVLRFATQSDAPGTGRLFFDLDLYCDLDFARRRMFLMLHKLFGGSRH
jgi:hypothetical protein